MSTARPEEGRVSAPWRGVALAVLGVLTVAGFFAPADLAHDLFGPFSIVRFAIMVGFVAVCWSCRPRTDVAESVVGAPRGARILAIVIPALVLVAAVIQVAWPQFAVWLVRYEIRGPNYRHAIFVKAAFELAACVIFVILSISFFRDLDGARHLAGRGKRVARGVGGSSPLDYGARRKQVWPGIVSALLAFVTLALAGEELSWGQRIFFWATPAGFASINDQRETNVHNMATYLFQNTWYFGCWVLLVALPFFRLHLTALLERTKKLRFLRDFLPPSYFVVIFAVVYGLVDPLRTAVGIRFGSILFSVVGTAAILVYLIVFARGKMVARYLVLLAVFVAVLLIELIWSRSVTINMGVPMEYLEMFIAFGIFVWALAVWKQVHVRRAEAVGRG